MASRERIPNYCRQSDCLGILLMFLGALGLLTWKTILAYQEDALA